MKLFLAFMAIFILAIGTASAAPCSQPSSVLNSIIPILLLGLILSIIFMAASKYVGFEVPMKYVLMIIGAAVIVFIAYNFIIYGLSCPGGGLPT